MKIFAVMMVRDEADIVAVNIHHHLAQGVDRFLVVDNGSTDGTDRVLHALARDGRLLWTRETGAFTQQATTTALAREAYLQGADWIIPVDADEFWYCPRGSLRELLEASDAGALEAEVQTFVQRREEDVPGLCSLLSMTRRPAERAGPLEDVSRLVNSGRFSYVEVMHPSKWISRASLAIEIAQGNHAVAGVPGMRERTEALVCLHAPIRARSILESKVEQGERVAAVTQDPQQAWHLRRWIEMLAAGRLAAEWEANSYRDGALDVFGERHPLVADHRLQDIVAPWIDQAVALTQAALAAGSRPTPTGVWWSPQSADGAAVFDRLGRLEEGRSHYDAELTHRDHLLQERAADIERLNEGVRWLESRLAEEQEASAWHAEKLSEARDTIAERDRAIEWLQGLVRQHDVQIDQLNHRQQRGFLRLGLSRVLHARRSWWFRGPDPPTN